MHQEFNRIQRKSLFIFKGQLNILRNPHNLQNKDATASTVNGCSTPQQFYGNQVKSVFLKKTDLDLEIHAYTQNQSPTTSTPVLW